MFAILLSDKMDPFYQNISSFPTVIFTFLLALCVLYWLVAVLGFVDLDFLDIDIPNPDGDIGLGDQDISTPDALAGLMLKLGLYGVPVTIIVSILSLIGWFISYYAVYFLFDYIPDGFLHYLAGIPILIGSFYLSALVTGRLIRPLRPFFKSATQDTVKLILGQTAIVRTSRVDDQFGEATLNDGGAGLIIKVRATGNETFTKGDRVVLLEYIPEQHLYRVISEAEFKGS